MLIVHGRVGSGLCHGKCLGNFSKLFGFHFSRVWFVVVVRVCFVFWVAEEAREEEGFLASLSKEKGKQGIAWREETGINSGASQIRRASGSRRFEVTVCMVETVWIIFKYFLLITDEEALGFEREQSTSVFIIIHILQWKYVFSKLASVDRRLTKKSQTAGVTGRQTDAAGRIHET